MQVHHGTPANQLREERHVGSKAFRWEAKSLRDGMNLHDRRASTPVAQDGDPQQNHHTPLHPQREPARMRHRIGGTHASESR